MQGEGKGEEAVGGERRCSGTGGTGGGGYLGIMTLRDLLLLRRGWTVSFGLEPETRRLEAGVGEKTRWEGIDIESGREGKEEETGERREMS